ncbi:MAG: 1,2-phenylacetyl-CoA epoxidase subunit PaaD [Hyphomonadaceae bacterium]
MADRELEGGPPPRSAPGVARSNLETLARVLASVPDPEIPAVSVIDLGIVRDISADRVLITPTYTGCPATIAIERMIRDALDANGFTNVAVETTLSPAWTTDWISDEGREKLRAYGIAPPPKGAAAASLRNDTHAQCPRCGSMNTEEISRFGSTPCKALWRCLACAEPFDRFKCH